MVPPHLKIDVGLFSRHGLAIEPGPAVEGHAVALDANVSHIILLGAGSAHKRGVIALVGFAPDGILSHTVAICSIAVVVTHFVVALVLDGVSRDNSVAAGVGHPTVYEIPTVVIAVRICLGNGCKRHEQQ